MIMMMDVHLGGLTAELRLRLGLAVLRLGLAVKLRERLAVELRRLLAMTSKLGRLLGAATEVLPTMEETLLSLHDFRPVVRLTHVVAAGGHAWNGNRRAARGRSTVAKRQRLELEALVTLLIRKAVQRILPHIVSELILPKV